jgi:hypothetical protein
MSNTDAPSRRLPAWWILAALTALALVTASDQIVDKNVPSTFHDTPTGMLGAHEALVARGTPPVRWRQPIHTIPHEPPGVLVLAAPWLDPWTTQDLEALDALLDAGWSVVYLFSGSEPGTAEQRVLAALDLAAARSATPPLLPWSWRSWRLDPARWVDPDGGPPLLVRRDAHALVPPPDAVSLYETEDGGTRAFSAPRGGGRVFGVSTSSVFANAWLGAPGNLVALQRTLDAAAPPGAPILFDEWHHGFRDPGMMVEEAPITPTALLAAHLGVVYLGAVWTLSRPFGRLRRSTEVPGSSQRRDLEALASLHQRGGHARQAGQRLLDQAHAEARAAGLPCDLPTTFSGSVRDFVRLARQVARASPPRTDRERTP